MHTHTVLFWAKDDLTAAERTEFQAGLCKLPTISWVRAAYIGRPSATKRSVVDSSYAFALTLRFDDLAGHDAYQIDPIHDDFVARCSKYWKKVVVYDYDDLAET